MLTAASKYTLYRRQSLLLPATDLARMNAILTGNLVHRFLLLQSLQGYSPLGLRAVTFTFYCHRFPFVVWTFFILVSGPKFGEYHIESYGLTASDLRNPLQLDIQKLSFLVQLLEQLAKYSATVAYQLELQESSGGMGIYGNFSTTNAGVDIAQITNLSGKENMTLSQTISKLSNIMLIIVLAIMIPVIVYAGFLMVLSGYDYEQYERGNELLWKVLPWAVWACACRFLVAAWIHVLSEAFRPIASF